MNSLKKLDFNVKQICLTAYRALLLLKHLMVKSLNEKEILDIFINDDFIHQSISVDNLRSIINSFKELGCIIQKTGSKNNRMYELVKNPFSLNLTINEIKLLNRFRKSNIGRIDLDADLNINSFINKLCLLIEDEKIIENLKSNNSLIEIDVDLIYQLKEYCKNKESLLIEYISGKNISEFLMVASYLKYEKDRLYIWGYSPKYDDFSYLRVDKIRKIKVMDKIKETSVKDEFIRYKIFDLSYFLAENEFLVEKESNEIIIDYKIENKFQAIQKFLELGCDCEIISPESFKKEFIDTLKSIKEVYKNG